MFYLSIVSTLIFGGALSVAGQRMPGLAAVLETSGGVLVMTSLILLGTQLSHLH